MTGRVPSAKEAIQRPTLGERPSSSKKATVTTIVASIHRCSAVSEVRDWGLYQQTPHRHEPPHSSTVNMSREGALFPVMTSWPPADRDRWNITPSDLPSETKFHFFRAC